MTLSSHLPSGSPRAAAWLVETKEHHYSIHQLVSLNMPLRLLNLISNKLNCIASVYCFKDLDRGKCVGCQKFGPRHSTLYQGIYSLTWTEVVRGVLVQILAQLVLPGASESFTERYSSSFLGCDAQCCFANLEHGIVGL